MSPDQIVLSVKASFAIQKATKNGVTQPSELLFDSMAQPLPPGARASVVSGRQLLYRIGSVYVDMEIDRKANSARAALVGQMLDSARPGHPLAGIPVALHERGRSIANTLSNDNGEFRLEFDVKNDLKLLLSMDRRHPVHLPITNSSLESSTSSPGKRRKATAGAGTSSTRQQT
jgi:hypothetical protein